MKGVHMKRLISFLLIGMLLLSIPVTPLAKPEKKVMDYVKIGDSLAAGWTPYGNKDSGYGEHLTKCFEQSKYTVE